jgi:hypothetical protein
MQPPTSSEPDLADERLFTFDRLAPERRNALEIAHRMDPGCLDELRLATFEGIGRGIPNRDQHPDRRHRYLALLERASRPGHVVQRTGDPNVLAGGAPRDLEPADEPRRCRQEPVPLVQASALDLDQPTQPFDLELLDRAVQLGEVLLDPRIRQLRQRLGPKRIHGRT